MHPLAVNVTAWFVSSLTSFVPHRLAGTIANFFEGRPWIALTSRKINIQIPTMHSNYQFGPITAKSLANKQITSTNNYPELPTAL